MPGPYFKGQTPSACGCFYPDVTRIHDDPVMKTRTLHCITHGDVKISLEQGFIADGIRPIPNEEWRKKERQRLRGVTSSKNPVV